MISATRAILSLAAFAFLIAAQPAAAQSGAQSTAGCTEPAAPAIAPGNPPSESAMTVYVNDMDKYIQCLPPGPERKAALARLDTTMKQWGEAKGMSAPKRRGPGGPPPPPLRLGGPDLGNPIPPLRP